MNKDFIAYIGNEEIVEILESKYDADLVKELLDRAGIDAIPTEETADELIEQASRILFADKYEDEEDGE